MFSTDIFLPFLRHHKQLIVTILVVANVMVQALAGVPDCIHANEGYAYPRPAIQLSAGIGAYSVAPSVATYTQGKNQSVARFKHDFRLKTPEMAENNL